MSILSELSGLIEALGFSVETGVFSDNDADPDEYVVLIPLHDSYELYCGDRPSSEIQGARVSLFAKGNYLDARQRLCAALLDGDFTVTERRHIGREPDTGYYHYSADVEKNYNLEEE